MVSLTHDEDATGRVRVWDPLVRIGHWVLVAAFAAAYLTEGEPEWLHSWSGYAIAITVALRIVWGFIGPEHARFADFVTGPGRVFSYLAALVSGRAERHIGHSPAGGAMTLALFAALAVTTFSGMATLAVEDGSGPLAGIIVQAPAESFSSFPALEGTAGEEGGVRQKRENVWEEVHEVSANLSLALIVLHILGVGLASLAHRENLPRSMITGQKRA
ncbi:cytochrome b/b6 domain-containing protein [Afifella pfennigii]|uniref:cytochrome b/b6 domain-containing protein n=1 Tax=Afifella pfennigii TaxID=209897 RepID=UPI0004797B66|nr:cytochrome b/b6 domain-containing protein [Afifella pfennigii]